MKKSILIVLLIAFAVGNLTSQKFEMVKHTNTNSSFPSFLGEFNGKLYYMINIRKDEIIENQLWAIDNNGTKLIKKFSNNSYIYLYNSKLVKFDKKFYVLFNYKDLNNKIWESDGTNTGTKEVQNLNFGKDAKPLLIARNNNKLIYLIEDENETLTLMSLNPENNNTEILRKFTKNSRLNDYKFTKFSDKLVFLLDDYGEYKSNFWITDGTSSGTKIIEPKGLEKFAINVDEGGLAEIVETGGWLYFKANEYGDGLPWLSSDSNKLWKSDGTVEGTKLIKDINPGGKSRIRYFTELEDKVFFTANHDLYGTELWITDGTEEGTKIVKDIDTNYSSYPWELFSFNKKLYFTASPNGNVEYLWATDGTAEGTKKVKELRHDLHPGYPGNYPIYEDKMYFSVTVYTNRDYRKLSYIDKNENIVDLTPDFANQENDVCTSDVGISKSFVIHQDYLYFCAKYNDAGYVLWRMNLKLTNVEENINSNDSVKLFPNPAKSFIKLQLNKLSDNYSYKILNSLGNVVSNGLVKSKEMKISTEHLVTWVCKLNSVCSFSLIDFQVQS